jgi:hypothetical protein
MSRLFALDKNFPQPIVSVLSDFQVMLALPRVRNHLGSHGQGREEQSLPEPYARLALRLAAVVNEFIVALAIEPNLRRRPSADVTGLIFG